MDAPKNSEQAQPLAVPLQRPVRPPAPMRAVRLTLKLDADDMRELSYALRTLAELGFDAAAIAVLRQTKACA